MPHELVESRVEVEEMLREGAIGYLGVSMDGMPYIVPLNYSYDNGKIYFHCALEGKKLDAINRNPEVCFAVGWQAGEVRNHAGDSVCHIECDSVLCFGRARILNAHDEKAAALNIFNRFYKPDAHDLPEKDIQRCAAVEIAIREITGRRERAGRPTTMFRYMFTESER